jgi:hypothetical protein
MNHPVRRQRAFQLSLICFLVFTPISFLAMLDYLLEPPAANQNWLRLLIITLATPIAAGSMTSAWNNRPR